MLGYYNSHFGPVPVVITKVEKSGARWEIWATVTQSTGTHGGKPIYPKGRLLLATEKAIYPQGMSINYNPNEAYKELLQRSKENAD